MFEKTGYFDERLDVGAAGCNGDSEMWYRILLNGFEIMYNPRAVVFHEHRREMKGLKKQIFNYMRGFTAAALIQQSQQRNAGYRKHLFLKLPKYYLRMIIKGFPYYTSRYSTIWNEMSGIISGLLYYNKHGNNS